MGTFLETIIMTTRFQIVMSTCKRNLLEETKESEVSEEILSYFPKDEISKVYGENNTAARSKYSQRYREVC